jgi:hypoxanthine phosphoribosyltransferase
MNEENITINELDFVKFIDSATISHKVAEIANAINQNHRSEKPVFVILLNGAFVFAADLLKNIEGSIETFFLKISSYHDLESTGVVNFEKDKMNKLSGRNIILVEDIIDTGTTMRELLSYLRSIGVTNIEICSLLCKPSKMKFPILIDYLGFNIGDEFVVGYGLDYNEKGRNLKHIYQLKEA